MSRSTPKVWKTALWSMLGLAIFALNMTRSYGQNITGEIDGTVFDASGAVIPGATVVVTSQDTGLVVRTLKADSHGNYSAPLLQIGTYRLNFSHKGFETSETDGIEVNVGGTVTQNARLPVGKSSASVIVTADPLNPDVETPAGTTVIGSKQLQELALSTRNFEEVLLLQPGVSYGGADQLFPGLAAADGSRNNPNFSVNGLLPNQLTWQMDGADMLDHSGSVQVSITPGVDTIKQTQVLRNSFGAQYGGGGSAQVIVATKAGSSAYHGDVFEFYRNPALNATPYFAKLAVPPQGKQPNEYNNFGGTFGGRVPYVSRSFFFFGMEFRRMVNFSIYDQGNYPSQAEVNGYFPTPVCAVISAGKCTTRATMVSNSPYPGNPFQIQKIDPVAQEYIKDVMQPALTLAVPNSTDIPETAVIQDKSTYRSTQTLGRIDHQFSDRLSAFVRYIYDPIHQEIPGALYAGPGYPGVGRSNVYSYGEDTVGHATWIVKPTMVLELGSSYEQYELSAQPIGTMLSKNSPDVQVQLPFTSTRGTIPGLVINGGIWNTLGPYLYRGHTVQEFANATKQFHQHTFYFGGNYEHYYMYTNSSFQSNAGQFVFTGAPATVKVGTQSYNETVFQAAFASFLTGNPSSFSQASIEPTSLDAASLYEAYLQDDWKITPRLTLDLGVRYTLYGQPYDRGGNLGGFQPEGYNPANAPAIGSTGNICLDTTTTGCSGTVPNPNYSRLNGIVTQGADSPYGRTISSTPLLNFAPRVGFALNVFGDGRTSLRGGYGIYYYQSQLSTVEGLATGNPAYVQDPVYNPQSFYDPAAGTATNTLVQNPSGQVRHWKQPYTESYSLDVQQQLAKGFLMDLAYVGNMTLHLPGEEDLNQPQPGAYVAACITGCASATNVPGYIGAGPLTTKLNQIRPYLGYGPIEFVNTRYFADYNGFQASLIKRFSTGSSFGANYTWSKSLANSQGLANVSGYATKAYVDPQNRFDLASEWGPTLLDRRHLFNANVIYVLPFFRYQRGFRGKVLGGWETSAIVQAVSGTWGTVTQNAVDPAGLGVLNPNANTKPARLDMIGDPNTGPKTRLQWFNKTAFEQVPAGLYRPGNEKPRSVLGPGYQTWNIGLFRNFELGEAKRIQVRAEAINAFNHTNWQGVSYGFNNANYGSITSAHEPRTIQVGGKFYF